MTDPTSPDIEHLAGDQRTFDQIRADLLSDLLLAADPSAVNGSGLEHVSARIQVTVAASTLIGADDRPAELDGHGPLDPEVARRLAGCNGGWTRLFLTPTGLVRETDSYTPSESMRRYLRARDQHCRFPGCRMPVHRCEIDHNHDHARGGRTHVDNLSHFCRTHHSLKHPDIDDRHRWSARQLPDGTVTWTSPLGRSYADRPQRRVMFV
ncbi:HNH endonuclease signature motif containing protein [Microbacterium hydrocarbonoxydans]|nr:HNH endonuclease signature motif containing protein [Microbacterium hydrocarbonoxydans]